MTIPRSRLALFMPATLAVLACGKGDEQAAAAAQPVVQSTVLGAQDIAVAALKPSGGGVLISGSLEPADVVTLTAQVGGTVRGVRVDRGTHVSRGSVLATIEAQGVRGQAAGARAQVAAARAQLSLAQQRLAAARRLHEAGAIADIEYRTAQANVDLAEAQLAGAQAQAAGAAESAQRATIVSPIDGVVSRRAVNGGEAVASGDPLFTVVNANALELAGQIGVQDAARVRAGQAVTFTLDAYPNQLFRGRVERVDPTADPATRQVGVFVRLPNVKTRIVGGQFARGRIETGGATTAVMIPESALFDRMADSAHVFIVNGNRVQRRTALLGARDETGQIAVRSGVAPGEKVLLNPSPDMRDGAAVSLSADRVQ